MIEVLRRFEYSGNDALGFGFHPAIEFTASFLVFLSVFVLVLNKFSNHVSQTRQFGGVQLGKLN